MDPLEQFGAATAAWFRDTFGEPTEVQRRGWVEIAAGCHALLCAPTGSGKTLAAFLAAIDRLLHTPLPEERRRCRVLYVSPLRALTVDVERNLRAPLRGITHALEREGAEPPSLRAAIRSGDTPAAERRDMLRHPPDILITTPESLYLLLTSGAREILSSVETVIVDEIHSLAATKRGAHLALSLERLACVTSRDPQRIGLSATQRPLEEVASFLGGSAREVAIVDAGRRKELDLRVEVPTDDMAGAEAAASEPASAKEPPRRSIWPLLTPRLLDLIRSHRSTIVFVNSRRHAERLAAQINDLAGEDLVKAHHGSIAREQRVLVEEQLKAGRLPAIVATSSLELGIDMGAVDLVVQVGSPGSVSAGLQRIGRAGHHVGEPSTGVMLPLHRGDLLESAVIAERMLSAEIEATRVPRLPLDVLAQQIVAMVAMEPWTVERLHATVSRAQPFAGLGPRALESVLDMLDGRYPSSDFGELRARIVWDRAAGTLRARPGAQRLAVVSGGTIPDRGLYSVNLFDDNRKVGELDEEMVYELRVGETFTLGATTWRCVEITASAVLVVPAPGEPGKLAFWHGDALGRPVEVGRALGAFTREVAHAGEESAMQRLGAAGCDANARSALMGFLDEQREATGALPDDRTIVVERFRDQIGDWRICVLSPWGARVHAPWALVVAERLRARLGLEVQSIHSDDGFALRLPDCDELPPLDALLIEPEEVQDAVTEEVAGSALFSARFRENAARALLLPRRRPGRRTPLWQQRQRSASLLAVASRYPSFPVIVETYRECLADVFDLDALAELMTSIRSRRVRLVDVETATASPWASSLLFEYVMQFMYEGDAPLAERRAQALTLDRELLAELLGSDDLRELLDPEAIALTELELQGLSGTRPRDADETLDLLRRAGDLSTDELAARGAPEAWIETLRAERRALDVRVAGERRVIAADDAGLYRDALGVALPQGTAIPAGDEAGATPLAALLLRFARTHAPFVAADPAQRWGVAERTVTRELQTLVASGALIAGHFRPGGAEREVCHPEVLQRIRRRSLASLRREVEAVEPAVLARFLLSWQGVGRPGGGTERLHETIAQLQGMALPVSALESDILPARVPGYHPGMLDQLAAAGEVVWAGRGPLGRDDGRIALFLRGDAPRLLEPGRFEAAGELHVAIRERLSRGACFFADLVAATGSSGRIDELADALWDLVWAGEVTNDILAPLRVAGAARGRPRRQVLRSLTPPRAQGRWSLVTDIAGTGVSPTERLAAIAEQLLRRHGVVTRETVLGEGVPGGFAALYPVLRAMEESGRVRRGYFVEGLGGAQFAAPGAVDGLRAHRGEGAPVVALAAVDPANPYGGILPWPELAGRPARSAGARVLAGDGEIRAYLERGGRSLLAATELGEADAEALAGLAERLGGLEIATVDGEPVEASPFAAALRAAGFVRTPRGLGHQPRGSARPLRAARPLGSRSGGAF